MSNFPYNSELERLEGEKRAIRQMISAQERYLDALRHYAAHLEKVIKREIEQNVDNNKECDIIKT